MTKLRAGILGAGLISGKKHVPAFLRQKHRVEVAAVCDLDVKAAERLAQKLGVPKVYSDPAEMLLREELDVVDICTPPQTHRDLAVEAMRQGAHVLIEKPLALCGADCDAMVDASREFGKKACVAHTALFYYPFVEARRLVEQGAIGRFRGMRILFSTPTDYITSKKDHWAHKLPGGVIGETGPHVIYMTLPFINPIRRVTVDAMKILTEYPWSRYEDYRVNLIGNQAISSIAMSYTSDQWSSRVELLGSEGILRLDLLTYLVGVRRTTLKPLPVGLSLLTESGQILKNWALMAGRVATGRYRSTHDILVERFVASILDGTPVPVTLEEGRETVRVLEMIVDKLDQERTPRGGARYGLSSGVRGGGVRPCGGTRSRGTGARLRRTQES
jgi:predicted dehydrogenase